MLAQAPSILGTLPSWILVVLALLVAWRISKGGGGSAVSELSKANEVLTTTIREEREKRERLGGEVRDLQAANAALSERTDFARAMAKQAHDSEQRLSEQFVRSLAGHEERAIERHQAQLTVLSMMADALAKLGYRSEENR